MKTLNKIILFALISIFLIFKFQISFAVPAPLQTVPVIDDAAVLNLTQINHTLNSILSITSKQFEKANNILLGILEANYQESINKIFTDSLKEEEYQEYSENIRRFVQSRQDMAANKAAIEPVLTEARNAGAYKALIELPNIIPCVNPNIRERFTNYLVGLATQFGLSEKAQEIADQIPDCYIQGSTITSFKKKINFFAWFTKPFQLNLAEISDSPTSSEDSPISISPAFQETEDTIQLSNLTSLSNNLMSNRAQEYEQRMKETIGDTFPVMQCVEETTEFDGGQYVCLEQQTLISSQELRNIKQSINLSNPSNQTEQDINIHQKFSQTQSLLKKIGLLSTNNIASTAYPIATNSDFSGNFPDKEAVREMIEKTCEKNFVNAENGKKTITYIACLRQFNNKFRTYSLIKKKQYASMSDFTLKTKNATNDIMEEIKNIQNQINEAKCPAMLNDLERTLQELEAKTDSYQEFIINTLQPIQSNLDNVATSLQSFSNEIDSELKSLASLPLDVLKNIDSAIDDIFGTFNSIAGLFGINLNLSNPLKGVIGDITTPIQKALDKAEGIVSKIQDVLDKVADVFVKFSNLISNIQNVPILRIDILNDVYALNNISTKLKAYKRAQRCYGSSSSVSFITQSPKPKQNQVIVIESKKSEPKSINFLALIKNFWQPKLVEFKNE